MSGVEKKQEEADGRRRKVKEEEGGRNKWCRQVVDGAVEVRGRHRLRALGWAAAVRSARDRKPARAFCAAARSGQKSGRDGRRRHTVRLVFRWTCR